MCHSKPPKCERLARKAVELGPDDPIALSASGMALAYVAGDLDAGDVLIDKSLELNPNLASGWMFSGFVKSWRGEAEIAISRSTRALLLSPHDPSLSNIRRAIAFSYFIAGRYGRSHFRLGDDNSNRTKCDLWISYRCRLCCPPRAPGRGRTCCFGDPSRRPHLAARQFERTLSDGARRRFQPLGGRTAKSRTTGVSSREYVGTWAISRKTRTIYVHILFGFDDRLGSLGDVGVSRVNGDRLDHLKSRP